MAGTAGDGEIGGMPAAGHVYAYANSLQRTVATAQFFITAHSRGVIFLCITRKKWALWTNL